MVLKLVTNAQSAAKLLYIIEERSTIIPSREVDSIKFRSGDGLI